MRLFAALVLLLALAAPAQADSFGELPFRPVGGVATCLRPTGVPGELVRWTKDGVELLRADGGGLTPAGTVRLGESDSCPEVAGQPNGAAVVAAVVREKTAYIVRVAVRDPGGSFGAPVTLKVPGIGEIDPLNVAVAVAPSGSTLLAVDQSALVKRRMHVFAFRRPAGGGFLAPRDITGARPDIVSRGIVAGADAGGGFTIAWTRAETTQRAVLEAASAPAGGEFGTVQRIGPAALLTVPALAVAPDGRALLAYPTDAAIAVAERAPGAAIFGERNPIGGPPESFYPVAAALGDDGSAAVAWSFEGDGLPGTQIATRAGPGAFGAPREVEPSGPLPETPAGDGDIGLYAIAADSPQDTLVLRAAVGGGRFVLAWPGEGAEVATGALAGGAVTRTALGSPVRGAESVTPVTLADGRTAIALADDDSGFGGVADGHGRLQLALPGAPRPASAPPPEITVPQLARQRLYVDDDVVLPLRCSGPCDVSVTAPAFTFAVRSRATAGPISVGLEHAPVVHGFVRVDVTGATPGSRATTKLHVRIPVTRRRSPPVPKPLDLRVKKAGGDLIVTWRTAFAARRTFFRVDAEGDDVLPLAIKGMNGGGKRVFRVRLKDAARARRVRVTAFGESDRDPRSATVRLR